MLILMLPINKNDTSLGYGFTDKIPKPLLLHRTDRVQNREMVGITLKTTTNRETKQTGVKQMFISFLNEMTSSTRHFY